MSNYNIMSIYSTEAIKTVEINAKTQNAYRCEFSLSHLDPDTVILPNMRLANVGCTVGTATNYNAMLGAKSIIKSIHLYSARPKSTGSTTLVDGWPLISSETRTSSTAP